MKKSLLALIISLCLVLTGCAAGTAETATDVSAYFSNRDLKGTWDESEAVTVVLTADGAVIDGEGAEAEGNVLSITAAGTYLLSGVWTDGTVRVSVGDEDKVQIVLSGASVTSRSSAALLVENADKVFVTLAESTENTLSNGGSFSTDSDIDAAVFARDDIVFNGLGALTVESANHGIVGKDDVKFTGGSYTVNAQGRGIDANDSVRIYDGSFAVVSQKDAIRAKHEEADKGYILIVNGSFDLNAGGGAANGPAHTENMGFGRGQGRNNVHTSSDSESQKGIKASGDITILGGAFSIDTADDAIHSDGSVTVSGGTYAIATGDDALHADAALNITDGSLVISQSYEGLEGKNITMSGGHIRLKASDDGLNAAGGNDQSGYGRNDMFSSDGVSSILISGGTLIINADGDGIDSNGDLTVTGGSILVSGPTNSGNGALDCAGTAAITGGTLIAAGAVGMAENFDSGSAQVSLLVNLSGAAGTVTVTDENGNTVLSGDVEKQYQCVVISSPDLKAGETYTVSNGSASTQVTVTSTVMGGGNSFGGWQNPGGRGGFGGGRGDWRQPDDTQGTPPTAPEGQQPPEMPQGTPPADGTPPDGGADGTTGATPSFPGGQQQFPGGQMPGGMGGPGGGQRGH